MIHQATALLASKLNNFLRQKFALVDDAVVVSNLIGFDGSVLIGASGKIVVTLLSIQKEETTSSLAPNRCIARPPSINLKVLVASSFSGQSYGDGLTFLSEVLGFLDANPVISSDNVPVEFDAIEMLRVESANAGIEAIAAIWAMLRVPAGPCLVYNVVAVSAHGKEERPTDPAAGTVPPAGDQNAK